MKLMQDIFFIDIFVINKFHNLMFILNDERIGNSVSYT